MSTQKLQVVPENGRIYCEAAYPSLLTSNDVKKIVLKVVRVAPGVGGFKAGDMVLVEINPSIMKTPVGVLVKPENILARLEPTDGADEMATPNTPQIIPISNAQAEQMLERSKMRLDG